MMHIQSAAQMQDFGEKFGRSLRGGEIFELVGDVGAGKTTFVRGLARGMGVTEQVQSPSFTINRVYDTLSGRRLVHYDFYRLQDAGIMGDELAEALSDDRTVVVVEWADAVAEILPAERLTLTIVPDSEVSRTITFAAQGEAANTLLRGVI